MNTDITALEYQIRQSVKFDGGCEVSLKNKKQSRFDNTMRLVFPFIKFKIVAFTFNPLKKETFLLKEVECKTVEEGLRQILDYVEKGKKNQNSYTVTWVKKGTGSSKREVSYFYCKTIKEAILKFYFDKEEDDYIVDSVVQNPPA